LLARRTPLAGQANLGKSGRMRRRMLACHVGEVLYGNTGRSRPFVTAETELEAIA